MKVAIEVTVEVTDEQRKQIANVLDDKVSKRDATRAEMKEFIWDLGSEWEDALFARWQQKFGEALFQEGANPSADVDCAYPGCTEPEEHDGDHLDLLGNPIVSDTESLI